VRNVHAIHGRAGIGGADGGAAGTDLDPAGGVARNRLDDLLPVRSAAEQAGTRVRRGPDGRAVQVKGADKAGALGRPTDYICARIGRPRARAESRQEPAPLGPSGSLLIST